MNLFSKYNKDYMEKAELIAFYLFCLFGEAVKYDAFFIFSMHKIRPISPKYGHFTIKSGRILKKMADKWPNSGKLAVFG